MRRFVIAFAFTLGGCSWQASLGLPGAGAGILAAPPPNTRVIAEPNGAVVEEPVTPPVETVLTGLSQTQAIRTYVRQLSR
jgi:hypothetical protein